MGAEAQGYNPQTPEQRQPSTERTTQHPSVSDSPAAAGESRVDEAVNAAENQQINVLLSTQPPSLNKPQPARSLHLYNQQLGRIGSHHIIHQANQIVAWMKLTPGSEGWQKIAQKIVNDKTGYENFKKSCCYVQGDAETFDQYVGINATRLGQYYAAFVRHYNTNKSKLRPTTAASQARPARAEAAPQAKSKAEIAKEIHDETMRIADECGKVAHKVNSMIYNSGDVEEAHKLIMEAYDKLWKRIDYMGTDECKKKISHEQWMRDYDELSRVSKSINSERTYVREAREGTAITAAKEEAQGKRLAARMREKQRRQPTQQPPRRTQPSYTPRPVDPQVWENHKRELNERFAAERQEAANEKAENEMRAVYAQKYPQYTGYGEKSPIHHVKKKATMGWVPGLADHKYNGKACHAYILDHYIDEGGTEQFNAHLNITEKQAIDIYKAKFETKPSSSSSGPANQLRMNGLDWVPPDSQRSDRDRRSSVLDYFDN